MRGHGDWPLVSGVTFMSGTRHDDTHVEYVLDTETWLGLYNGLPYERVEEPAGLIERSGLKARAFRDLRPAQWSKLIFNATVNAVAALTGLPHDAHFAAEERFTDLGHLVHGLVDEGKAVATAAGIELYEDPWEMNVLATRRGSAHYPSMLEDVEARRSTEIDLITGSLVREAERLGVLVPLHTALYRLRQAKEDSWQDCIGNPKGGRNDGTNAVERPRGAARAVCGRGRDGGNWARRFADERGGADRDRLGVRQQGKHVPVRQPGARGGEVRVNQVNARRRQRSPAQIDTCDTNNNNAARAKSCAASLLGKGAHVIFTT